MANNASLGPTVSIELDLLSDTTPQLGGNLDINSNDITGTGNISITGDLNLTSTDTGATENPTLDLFRNSTSPAVGDVLAHINFSGKNDADQKIVYAKINADIADETDGTEDGRLDVNVMAQGSESTRMTFQGNGHTFFTNRDVRLQAGIDLLFEGATQNGTRTTLTVVDPTSARTVTLPDASGTVLTTGNSDTPTTTTSSGDADFVLVDDGGTMKKITPTDLGIGSGGGGISTGKAIAMSMVFG